MIQEIITQKTLLFCGVYEDSVTINNQTKKPNIKYPVLFDIKKMLPSDCFPFGSYFAKGKNIKV